ncbi:EthD domain-containing protein [Spirillospora sp. NPDC048911]|uniref:EthD domain-containing protein n=1 Tax=Spirillospora sp. NPDC048911 TaxID=3364527 RepID=UPI00371B7014
MALLTKLPELTLEQFDAHWHRPHGDPLTLAIPLIRHAVQNARLAAAEDLTDAPFHGIAEIWLDNMAAVRGLPSDSAYLAAVADQKFFMDAGKLQFLCTLETSVDNAAVPAGPPAVKLIRLFRGEVAPGPAGLEAGPPDPPDVADRERGRAVGAVGHTWSRCIPIGDGGEDEDGNGDGETPAFDAIRELWFPDLGALRAAPARDPVAWDALCMPTGADPGSSNTYVATERRLR